MEYWFFHRILSIFNFVFKTIIAINPIFQYPSTHYSIVPAFQYSNWGEAPNLFFQIIP